MYIQPRNQQFSNRTGAVDSLEGKYVTDTLHKIYAASGKFVKVRSNRNPYLASPSNTGKPNLHTEEGGAKRLSKICSTAIPPSSDSRCIFYIVWSPRVKYKTLLHQPRSLYSYMVVDWKFRPVDNAIVPPALKETFKDGYQSSPVPVQKHVMESSTRCYEAFCRSLIFVANNIKSASGRRFIVKLLGPVVQS